MRRSSWPLLSCALLLGTLAHARALHAAPSARPPTRAAPRPPTRPAPPVIVRAPGERPPSIRDFWLRPSPARTRTDEQRLQRALGHLRRGISSGLQRRVVDRQAVLLAHAILGLLVVRNPRSARYWYWYGYAALALGKHATVIRAWQRVWKLDPNHWDTSSMAFELGIVYAKQGQYARSVAVYRKGIPAAVHLDTRSIMASNAAESLMALGKLREAVALYQKSLRLRPSRNWAALWGLMIAYDRLGQANASQRARQQALTLDPTLRGLTGPGVFFVPRGDLHYYLALAYEGLGRVRDAQQSWARFLVAQPRSRWVKRAREHAARLALVVARFRPRVFLVAARPTRHRRAVARLVPVLQRCYDRSAKRKPVPEGQLPLHLTVSKQRITAVTRGWAARPIQDVALRRCVRSALQNRRWKGLNRGKIIAVFQLELSP